MTKDILINERDDIANAMLYANYIEPLFAAIGRIERRILAKRLRWISIITKNK